MALGIVALGLVAFGLMAFGLVALGLVALGCVALGSVALGFGLIKCKRAASPLTHQPKAEWPLSCTDFS